MWLYKDVYITSFSEDIVGFVYCITHIESGRKYIGKKLVWKNVYRKVNGKRKRVKVPSDWQDYFGSSNELKEELKSIGPDKYRREILRLCKSKGEMSYYELKEQMDRRVLFSDDYYNQFIGCKIHAKHVKDLKDEEL